MQQGSTPADPKQWDPLYEIPKLQISSETTLKCLNPKPFTGLEGKEWAS